MDLLSARNDLGLHEYDGMVQDLSPSGVRASLARVGQGDAPQDSYDQALVNVHERRLRSWYGEQEVHRWNAQLHLQAIDLSGYDRAYAPAQQRTEAAALARALLPEAVDNAIASLDQLSSPGAQAALHTAEQMRNEAGEDALARLISHLRVAAHRGGTGALGPTRFMALVNAADGTDLGVDDLLAVCADERVRAAQMLTEAADRLRPGLDVRVAVNDLLASDDVDASDVLARARRLVEELTVFVEDNNLLTIRGGECDVAPAPMSSATSQAIMLWNGPFEQPAPSVFQFVLPTPDMDQVAAREWLQVFGEITLPAIAAHEAVPGHASHAQALRHVATPTRRALLSPAFIEGWAHYAEQLCVEHGFRAHDPRFRLGVALESLLRVARLQGLLRFHCENATLDQLTGMFQQEAFLARRSARAEAFRVTVDPMCGGYTLGKAALRMAHARGLKAAPSATGRDIHDHLLSLGAPPLGLLTSLPRPTTR